MINDVEGLSPLPGEMYHALSTICLHINQKAHVAYNFNCLSKINFIRSQAVCTL